MAENLLGKMKNFLFENPKEEEFENDYTEEQEDDFEQPMTAPTRAAGKIVSIHPALNVQMKVSIFEPVTYEECSMIGEALKSKKIVMVNLENVKEVSEEDKMRCFLNGVIFAIDGAASSISDHILVLTPHNVEIDGNVMKRELERKGVGGW